MFFKWTGGLLILFAGSGMGVWLAWGYKKRLQTLETLRRMVYCLKGEIVYSHAPLGEAFERIGKREKSVLGELFMQILSGKLTSCCRRQKYPDHQQQTDLCPQYPQYLFEPQKNHPLSHILCFMYMRKKDVSSTCTFFIKRLLPDTLLLLHD